MGYKYTPRLVDVIWYSTDIAVLIIVGITFIIYKIFNTANKPTQKLVNDTFEIDIKRLECTDAVMKYEVNSVEETIAIAEHEPSGRDSYIRLFYQDKIIEVYSEGNGSYKVIKDKEHIGCIEFINSLVSIKNLDSTTMYQIAREKQLSESDLFSNLYKLLVFDFRFERPTHFIIRNKDNEVVGKFFPSLNNLQLQNRRDLSITLIVALIILIMSGNKNL
ncbi:hypothetical protein [Dendrosporobacter sp. 1207_IL3150]|uniref:hypothetical protein n=1 Tax=Dendrosporobacter sp. 1207_IL3150 TaxID=3084054 RepID=UPI002FDB7403